MWQRYTFYDLRVIGHYLGVLILFSAAALAIPLVTAILCQEWEPASRYLQACGIALCVGGVMQMMRFEPGKLNSQQALAVTGFAWIVLALIGAIPLLGCGHYDSYLDALFDAVSGWTATGASVISDLDHLSTADNMWRFTMHLFGGLGLVVVALSLGMLGRGASSSGLFASEAHSEHVVPNIVQTARIIAAISLSMIAAFAIVLFVLCMASGVEPVRAFFHGTWMAISGFMTAGFVPTTENIYYYHSPIMEVLLMVLMLMGGISFTLYVVVWKGQARHFLEDTELRTMALWLLILVAVFTLALSSSVLFSDTPGILRRGLFMVFAAASTTGFSSVTANQISTVFSSGAFLMLAAAMAVGLSTGSTAGGIKMSRIAIIFKSIMATVRQTASADSVKVVSTYNHIGRHIVDEGTVKSSMTIFALFIMVYAIGTFAGIAHGYDASMAIFDSVAMASNGGLTSGIVSPDMPATLEFLYILEMWAGRLEFVTLIALIMKIAISLTPSKRGKTE